MKDFEHVMLDIETLGTNPGELVLSIAAVPFDIETGETGQAFYERIDADSAMSIGLKMNFDTLKWWLSTDNNELLKLLSGTRDVRDVLHDLNDFMYWKDVQVWGNSARFDCGMLQDAYAKIGESVPWNFRNERCLRTLVSFAPEIREYTPFEGTRHDALDDCRYQIKYCVKTWNHLK